LDKRLLQRRQAMLEQVGIRFSLNTSIDGEILADLLEKHDAVFLGLGAQKSRSVDLLGQHLPGVEQAIGWLHETNRGTRAPISGKHVLVLGGGDSAMDCARSAIRLGAKVSIAYRGPEECLRASPLETYLAREEGVEFYFDHTPLECTGSGVVSGVRFKTPLGNPHINADSIILAMGQRAEPPSWLSGFGVATESDGRIRADERGRTTHPRIWAGGDNTHGPDLAVVAMAAGRKAAEDIMAGISGFEIMRRRV
ncbi:MAG: FAD-dependent oxidoreductase, partial [Candidatus Thiodiazotropha sp.]